MKLRNTNTQDFFIKLLIPLIFAYNADLLPLTVASAECQCPSPETGSYTDRARQNVSAQALKRAAALTGQAGLSVHKPGNGQLH